MIPLILYLIVGSFFSSLFFDERRRWCGGCERYKSSLFIVAIMICLFWVIIVPVVIAVSMFTGSEYDYREIGNNRATSLSITVIEDEGE